MRRLLCLFRSHQWHVEENYAHEHAPVGVLPGLEDDASRLVFAGRLRIRLRDCGLRGLRGRVHRKPASAHSAAQRRAEVRVDQPDRRRRQRPAGMPGLAAATASLPTSPKLGVERLQSLSIEPGHRHCPQHRPHMPVQPAHHAVARGRLQLDNLKPPVEQLRRSELVDRPVRRKGRQRNVQYRLLSCCRRPRATTASCRSGLA
jgi:hypothetical protein